MKKESSLTIYVSLVAVFLVIQAGMIYFVVYNDQRTVNLVNKSISDLGDKIDSNRRESQANLNSLTSELSTLSAEQSSLNSEVAKFKATSSSDFSGVISNNLNSVVTIKTDISQGTGFIITDDGYIVTNYHVVEGARAAGAFSYDSKQHSVKLVGSNPNMDIALLKMTGIFDAISLGDSDGVRIGEKAVAIGNPLGLSFTASEGIVSSINRKGLNDLPYYFQIDVPLNPGNSGGPLIDTNGDVIGINNFKAQGAENIGFALEINYAKTAINDIAMKELNMTLV